MGDAISLVDALSDSEVKPFPRDACVEFARAYAAMVAAIAALENRGIAAADGYLPRQTAQLVKQLTRQSLGDCRWLVKVARLTSQRATGGSCFADAELPATAVALAEVGITPGHVREIVKAMSVVPPGWPDREGFDRSLAGLARSGYPEDVKELGKVIADRIEQETPPPEDDDDDGRLAELILHGITCAGVLPHDTRPFRRRNQAPQPRAAVLRTSPNRAPFANGKSKCAAGSRISSRQRSSTRPARRYGTRATA
ncbi:DUF222 domain-containing protein [Fodinicola acaciae]|uniref:DUF222 domain-containing protein n=1 Tax=Fodinicola acaciae TaxID=2681555 RepID=UPI0013D63A7E|nr:DUF222 domain-containing protein [Fodinicola acaciae]